MGVCVGIDVSKQHLDWALGSETRSVRASNTASGIRRIVSRLSEVREFDRVIVESTGGYEQALTEALDAAGLPVILVNPWRVRRFGEGLGVLAKTDALDARILPLITPPDPECMELRAISRRIEAMTKSATQEKNRLHAADAFDEISDVAHNDIQVNIRHLEKRIARLRDQALTHRDPS